MEVLRNLNLNVLKDFCYFESLKAGWHDPDKDVDFGTRIALIHSELSEVLEEFRVLKNEDDINKPYYKDEKPEGIAIELADVIIRVMDLCGKYNIDIDGAVKEKLEFNRTRTYRHGNKRC